jgi:hypothetical protein
VAVRTEVAALIVAAHQPAYLPWLGYLAKMAAADVFVIMDDLQYEDQNFQNRNRVKLNNGAAWITVPLVRGSQSDRIMEKVIRNQIGSKEHWQFRTWRTLRTHYGRAPHFARYASELEEVYNRTWTDLLTLDLHLIRSMMTWLEIDTSLVLASSLGLEGQRSDRIVDLCKKLGADTYLSGTGASRRYLDVEMFEREGIRVEWHAFDHPTYPQRYPQLGFISHLSALDLLLNCGPQSAEVIR